MTQIDDILKKLENEEIRLVNSGEPQEIAFQLAIASLTDAEVKMWHSHNMSKKKKQMKR